MSIIDISGSIWTLHAEKGANHARTGSKYKANTYKVTRAFKAGIVWVAIPDDCLDLLFQVIGGKPTKAKSITAPAVIPNVKSDAGDPCDHELDFIPSGVPNCATVILKKVGA